MKKINAFIIGGVLTSLCMFACNDEDENAENNERNNQTTVTTSLKGSFLNHSECKGFENSNSFAEDYDFKYVFDLAKGTGTITHINNMMSCSMEDISTNVTIKGDSIFITETGIDTLNANCICPYDITTQFKGVEKKLYHVIINPGFIDRCSFDIDLRKQTEGGWKKPKGEFLSHTDCKNGGDKELRADVYSSTIFKAKYNFDLSKGTGTITHIDAVHNCCPEDITTFVRIEGDSIFISESEYGGICKCVCPYDVVSTFSNIEKKVYHVQMKGGIEFSYNTYVDFDIDLTKQTEGEWTKDLNNEEIKGSFLRVSDCKGSPYEEDSLRSAFNDFKASYTFDMQKGVGTITHVNAVYNCCPGKLYTSVEVVGNNITINEINEPDEYTCNCDCTYDLSTQLEGVKEGIYHIKIVDYRGTHSFDIDLSKETEGTFSGTYE